MASTIPAGGISLRGPAEEVADLKPGTSSAILVKFGQDVLQDLKSAAKDELRFVTGNTPKLRIGGRTIDLNISADAFRNELYASTTGSSTTDLTFTSIVSHWAELKSTKQHGAGETAGTDAALAALQNSLASYKQEKEANQTTISNKVLDVPKNRFDAARKEKLDRKKRLLDSRHGSQPPSPSLSAMGTPRLGAAPTSVPLSEDEVRLKAMRKPLIHLLAIGSTTKEEIREKTHIPKDDLDLILLKVGKQVDGKWQLAERAFKELAVWSFGYPSKSDRDSTIDNAIRAYDRLRLGTDDNLWQLLLPKEDRGKGKVLSRLHLNGGVGGAVKASLTPHYQPSPTPHLNSEDKVASSANTPRLGSSTPRPASSKGDVMKRLLSKDPQKAHRIEEAKMKKTKAAEEAKEKKRKEREDAASDREGRKPAKKQATAKKATNSKVKSADIVHSSDDESGEDGEVKERPTTQPKPKPAPAKKATASSTESSDSAKPIREVKKVATKAKPSTTGTKTSASPAVKAAKPAAAATAGKSTPQTANGLSAPSSQHKARSPSAVGSRPGVPSPLGAARPRVASDVSDRNAVGVQRVRQGAETPKGLGITNGVRKRADTATSKGASTPNVAEAKPKEKTSSDKTQKPTVNGTATPKINGSTPKPDVGTKRKASDPPPQSQQAPKHRKTESNSSLTLSVSATNSSTTSNHTIQTSHTAQTSPDASSGSTSSDTSAVLDTISYKTGVNQAEKFKEQFYPAYIQLYDEIVGMQRKGEKVGREKMEQLRKWHERLVEMKREIQAASRREHGDE